MTWVLTSYIVAAAIMTPLSGWLAGQLGRTRVFLYLDLRLHDRLGAVRPGAVAAADRARAAAAGHLRRGADPDVAGHAARHQSARAPRPGDGDLGHGRHDRADPRARARRLAHRATTAGAGSSSSTCRSAFCAFFGVLAFMPETTLRKSRFDFFGFAALSLAIGAFQLMLDRGQTQRLVQRPPRSGSRPRSPASRCTCSSCTC